MSSSVLRNVIHPRNIPSSISRSGVDDFGDPSQPSEDMELVLGVLVENAPVSMAMFDQQMRYILANRAWVEEFGLKGVQPLIGKSQYEVFPGLHPGWRQVYERSLGGHVIRSEHDALSGPDGSRIIYRWEVRPWRRQIDASVGGLMVTCERFSQNGADAAQNESESRLESISRKNPLSECLVPMLLLDERGVVLQANGAAARLCLSRGVQEGVSEFWELLAEGHEAAPLKLQILSALESLTSEESPESKIVTMASSASQTSWAAGEGSGNGAVRPGRWLFARAQNDGISHCFTAVALPPDLTPRVPLPPTNLPAIASAVATISQPPSPDVLNSSLEMRRLQDDLARARQELRTLHEAGRTFTQRDTRAKQYLDALPCGVLVLDELGTPVYQNEQLTKLLGRSVQKEETVEQWLGAACPSEQHREDVAALWREDVWRRQLTRTFSLATADGLLKEVEFQPMSLPGGGLLISIQDATEKCRHEEQLRSTEAKFRALLHEAPLPVVLMDKTGSVFEVNHRAESFLGHPKNELRRYPLDAWLEPESSEARRDALRQMEADSQRASSLDVLVKQTDGSPVSARLHLVQVTDSEGHPHCTIHFFDQASKAAPLPVPATNQEEPFVQQSGGSLQEVETLLFKTNVNGRIKECSARGLALLGLAEGEAEGRPLHQHFRPSDATGFYAELTRLSQATDEIAELTCYAQGGSRKSCRVRVTPRGGEGFDFELHELNQVAVVGQSSEPSLASALPEGMTSASQGLAMPWPAANLEREKLLLSETHHRIKNHLQIISSLLNLESNTITDTSARNALRSSQNRVRSIADLHQHLYQIALGMTENFTDFADVLLQRLRECYQVEAERVPVYLNLQAGVIQQEWLMPLALTLNETLSNCFEHAFPEGRKGEVHASLTFAETSGELVVMDNGVGLSESLRPGTGSGLGLKILAVFAEQMRGQLLLGKTDSGGTEIRLRFPIASADI